MLVGKYGYSCCNLMVLIVKLKGIKLKRQLFHPVTVIHLYCQAIYVFILDCTIRSFCFLFRLWKEWRILHDQWLLSNLKMLLRSCSGAALCPSWSRLICFTVIMSACLSCLCRNGNKKVNKQIKTFDNNTNSVLFWEWEPANLCKIFCLMITSPHGDSMSFTNQRHWL